MTNTTNETAPWRSPSGKYAVRWIHLSIGWRFWAFERWTGEDVGHFTSKTAAIRACERAEKKSDAGIVRAALVIGVLAGMMGCHGTVPPPTTETVGQLAAGPSVWHAPTHATTDFGHAEIVETGDDDRTATITTTVRADAGEADAAELPDIQAKDQGLKTGEVRQ